MSDENLTAGQVVGRDNRRSLKPFVLRKTPHILKTAVVDMFDRHRDATLHHINIRLYKFKRTSSKVEFPYDESEAVERFTLEGDDVRKLLDCLETIPELTQAQRGDTYVIIKGDREYRLLESDKGKVLVQLLSDAAGRGDLDVLLQAADLEQEALEHIGAAARQLHYRRELDQLILLVGQNPREPAFQEWVWRNYWVFGTEYVDRPEVRDLARRCQIDILLESIDGFFDVIELKRPSSGILVFDEAHDCYRPHSDLSEAIGQVVNYLQRIEDYRLHIQSEDKLSLLKPRGRIVIGRSVEWQPRQHEALRKLNAAFHNIDIMTYDHLIARGEALIKLYRQTRPDLSSVE
jgi:hypothetical protein